MAVLPSSIAEFYYSADGKIFRYDAINDSEYILCLKTVWCNL